MTLIAQPMTTTFDDACRLVLASLRATLPMAHWSVTELSGDDQVFVHVDDTVYGVAPGLRRPWPGSLCSHMVAGAPAFAPDVAVVPGYVQAVGALPIAAYVGAPIFHPDGRLFGTLCGLDPHRLDPGLADRAGLVQGLAALLEQVLAADVLRSDALERDSELHWRGTHDDLTGLPNRAAFTERVAAALADRGPGAPELSVLVLDLLDLPAVNDALGHAVGDRLLVDVASRLRRLVRPQDTVARLSGGEFAVLVLGGTAPEATAHRIARDLDAPSRIDGVEAPARVTVGMTSLPAGDTGAELTSDALLIRADVALRSARRDGRTRVAVHDPAMSLPGVDDLRLREPLRQAIAGGALELHYQPIVDLVRGEIASFEALARWDHDGQAVPPDVFVPVAARAGLLPDLTAWALDGACAQLAQWSQQRGHRRTRVAVNVSPESLGDLDFPRRVAACLARHGVLPGQLVLEITEDALLTDPRTAAAVTARLRRLGTGLSLDDFGTGFSSLVHLREIPLDSIKIDRAFIRDLDTSPATRRFLQALLSFGRDLGLVVVVEGVERPGQAAVLRELGCGHAQGWLFARPVAGPSVAWDPPPS